MKNYVIIGGSSGIGLELVNQLEKDGNNIIATYHTHPIQSRKNVNYVPLNVKTDLLNMDYLPEVLHGLAYCPGSINLKPFHRFKEEQFIDDFKLQVTGAVKIIQQVLPRLKASGNAAIVLFSTIAVQKGFSFHSQVSISKGAIEGLTKALSAEFAPTIRVNAIAPSLTNTPLAEKLLNTPEKIKFQSNQNPLKRIGEPNDIANLAEFLISPKSLWITGQILHIDGGFSSLKI